MPNREKLQEFVAWCGKHISGDEKGEAQIFLDHLFHGFGHPGGLKEADPKKDLLTQLFNLNLAVAANIEPGPPVTAPGIPKNYSEPKKLVTEDCINPVEASA